jgi:hypothetical protein
VIEVSPDELELDEELGLTVEEEQLRDQVETLEIALENIGYIAEGKGPVRTKKGKIKLMEAFVLKALHDEETDDPRLARQMEQVENEEA